MRAYVQQLLEGDPSYFCFNQTAYWFGERGYEVVRFDYPQLDEGFLDRGLLKHPDETIVAGGVKTIREALVRAGRPLPDVPNLPESLKPWIGRKFWTTTFGEIRSLVDKGSTVLPLHIKPLRHEKLFTGKVVQQRHDLVRLGAVDDAEPVLAQESVEFLSEWRAYVLRDRIVLVAHYRADPLLFPDPLRLRQALTAIGDHPIAFSMDWGITPRGETLLIEVNDGIALGNYGVKGAVYTAMIEARWRQLMGLPDNGIGERL
jgi:ATP-grasp domain-containing protein